MIPHGRPAHVPPLFPEPPRQIRHTNPWPDLIRPQRRRAHARLHSPGRTHQHLHWPIRPTPRRRRPNRANPHPRLRKRNSQRQPRRHSVRLGMAHHALHHPHPRGITLNPGHLPGRYARLPQTTLARHRRTPTHNSAQHCQPHNPSDHYFTSFSASRMRSASALFASAFCEPAGVPLASCISA